MKPTKRSKPNSGARIRVGWGTSSSVSSSPSGLDAGADEELTRWLAGQDLYDRWREPVYFDWISARLADERGEPTGQLFFFMAGDGKVQVQGRAVYLVLGGRAIRVAEDAGDLLARIINPNESHRAGSRIVIEVDRSRMPEQPKTEQPDYRWWLRIERGPDRVIVFEVDYEDHAAALADLRRVAKLYEDRGFKLRRSKHGGMYRIADYGRMSVSGVLEETNGS